MHAGFPQFNTHFITTISQHLNVPHLVEPIAGQTISQLVAQGITMGIGILFKSGMISPNNKQNILNFIENHMVMSNQTMPDGIDFFQGKYLIRTKKPDDQLNIYLCFCPNPNKMRQKRAKDHLPDADDFIFTQALSENEADAIEKNMAKVDLVIRFRDIPSLLNLATRQQVDVVGLLLENVVQLTGNVGYLFKLGAIGKALEQELLAKRVVNNQHEKG